MRQLWVRGSRQELAGFGVIQNLGHIDDADRDRLMRTSLDTCGGFTHSQPVRAHIALANDALRRVILRHVIRASQCAVLTTKTLIVEMLHDARDDVLFIRIDRASIQASWLDTVMTSSRHMLHDGIGHFPYNALCVHS